MSDDDDETVILANAAIFISCAPLCNNRCLERKGI